MRAGWFPDHSNPLSWATPSGACAANVRKSSTTGINRSPASWVLLNQVVRPTSSRLEGPSKMMATAGFEPSQIAPCMPGHFHAAVQVEVVHLFVHRSPQIRDPFGPVHLHGVDLVEDLHERLGVHDPGHPFGHHRRLLLAVDFHREVWCDVDGVALSSTFDVTPRA